MSNLLPRHKRSRIYIALCVAGSTVALTILLVSLAVFEVRKIRREGVVSPRLIIPESIIPNAPYDRNAAHVVGDVNEVVDTLQANEGSLSELIEVASNKLNLSGWVKYEPGTVHFSDIPGDMLKAHFALKEDSHDFLVATLSFYISSNDSLQARLLLFKNTGSQAKVDLTIKSLQTDNVYPSNFK